jgi:hypothetical protein
MPAVVTSPATPHPITTVRAAVAWARGKGIRIRLVEDFGVVCISHHAAETWVQDPRAEGPNVIGAVMLMVQPQLTDVDKAAALAMAAPIAYVEGFAAGCAKADPSKAWETSVARRLYAAGFEAGLFTRSWMHRGELGAVSQKEQA